MCCLFALVERFALCRADLVPCVVVVLHVHAVLGPVPGGCLGMLSSCVSCQEGVLAARCCVCVYVLVSVRRYFMHAAAHCTVCISCLSLPTLANALPAVFISLVATALCMQHERI